MTEVLIDKAERPIPILLIDEEQTLAYLGSAPALVKGLAARAGFKGKAGQILVVPDGEGAAATVLAGVPSGRVEAMSLRALPAKLSAGDYIFAPLPDGLSPAQAALAWALGAYRFDRYKKKTDETPRLVVPDGVSVIDVRAIAHACALARDMVNTPANDMGPKQIETIAHEVAHAHGADFTVTSGDDLLEANYPVIHAVGRAADAKRAPRLIELNWGDETHPKVAIIGKGVVFDTGGLDIKASAGMRLMKKVGSSRVDLQACKLEYSIVSPK